MLIDNNIYRFESIKLNKNKPITNKSYENSVINNLLSFQSNKLTDVLKTQGLYKVGNSKGYQELKSFEIPYYPHIQGKIYQLNNGQKVVVIPKPGPIVLQTDIKVGSLNETEDIRGISHFIEHSLYNGSKNYPGNSFDVKASEMGFQTNAGTDNNLTSYYILSTMPEDFEESIKMHSDMIENPVFTDESIEKEKNIVIKEIQEYADDPLGKGSSIALKKLYNIKSSSNDLTLGKEDNIRNLTKEKVQEYYDKWYRPDNTTTYIIGSIEPEHAVQLASKYFTKAKPQTPIEKIKTLKPITQTKITKVKSAKVNNTALEMLLPITTNSNIKEIVCFEVLNKILTANQNALLTKKLDKINISADSFINNFASGADNQMYMILLANINNNKEKAVLKTVQEVFEELATKPVSKKQLLIAKTKCENEFNLRNETTEEILEHVSRAINNFDNLNHYTDKIKLIQSVTAEDIQEVARKYLSLQKASIAFVYPKNKSLNISAKQINAGNISFTGKVNTTFNLNNVKQETLSNNVVLAINDDPNAIRTTGKIQIQVDKLPEVKPGIPYVLSLMLNKDSKNLTEKKYLDITDLNNIEINISPGVYAYKIGINCPKNQFTKALKLVKEKLYNISFTEKNLEKTKINLLNNLESEFKDANENANSVIYKDHPYGHTLNDIKQSINNITLEDLTQYYNYMFNNTGNNTQITATVTGQISSVPNLKEDIKKILEETFPQVGQNKIFDKNKIPKLTENTVVIDTDETDQAEIIQKIPLVLEENIKDYVGLQLLNLILGSSMTSRLYLDLREKQKLAYSVDSSFNDTEHKNSFNLLINTSIYDEIKDELVPTFNNIQKSIEGFKANLEKVFNEPVSETELRDAKKLIKAHMIASSQKSFSKTNKLMLYMRTPEGLSYLDKLNKAIEDITAEEIQVIAKKYLENQPSVISILTNEDAIEANIDYLKTLGNLKRM